MNAKSIGFIGGGRITRIFLTALNNNCDTKIVVSDPNDDALKKMLFLAYRDLSKKWTMPIQNWAIIISNFSVYFDDRFQEF